MIVTDLDGTLIDHNTYDFKPVIPTIARAKSGNVPICICSSKTRAEIELYRRALGIDDPFVSENGGAIVLPDSLGNDRVVELGTTRNVLVRELRRIRDELGVRVRGFHELNRLELSAMCGLSEEQAGLALMREYDEPFWMEGAETDLIRFCRRVSQDGFIVMKGGRFHHLVRDTDKGRAVEILLSVLRQSDPKLLCAAVGDSPNDIPMLLAADIPILVQRNDGAYDAEVRRQVSNVRLARGIGPEGWRAAIEELLDDWLAEADGVEDVSDAPEYRG